MDCESENVYNISKFLSLVNKMLHELKGDVNYIWNPHAIMTDENAANKIAVGNILGEDLHKRMVSCQWHYLICAKKQSSQVHDKDDQKEIQGVFTCFCWRGNQLDRICMRISQHTSNMQEI